MRAGLCSLVKSMGWEAGGESTSWIFSYSSGEKRKLMQVSALLSWKEQDIRYPVLANLRPTKTRSTSTDSPLQTVSPPSLPLPHNQASLGLSYQASLGCSCLSITLYDLLFEIPKKKSRKRGKRNLHTQWNYLISHDSFMFFPNSRITYLLDSRSILFAI